MKRATTLELAVLALVWHAPGHERHGEDRLGSMIYTDDVTTSPVRGWAGRARGAMATLGNKGLLATQADGFDCHMVAVAQPGYELLGSGGLLGSLEPVRGAVPAHFMGWARPRLVGRPTDDGDPELRAIECQLRRGAARWPDVAQAVADRYLLAAASGRNADALAARYPRCFPTMEETQTLAAAA